MDCAKQFMWIVSLEFHNTLNEVSSSITPNLQVSKNWVSVELNNMPKITQLINGLTRNWTKAICL